MAVDIDQTCLRRRRVGLAGPIGAGKSAVARLMQSDLTMQSDRQKPAPIVSFADPIKDLVANVLGISREELDYNKEKYRRALIGIGEGMRNFDEDFWVDRFQERYLEDLQWHEGLIVDDVRRMNEAYLLRNNGFVLIRIQPSYYRTIQYLTKIRGYSEEEAQKIMTHPTENSLGTFKFDIKVEAGETPEETYKEILRVAHQIWAPA